MEPVVEALVADLTSGLEVVDVAGKFFGEEVEEDFHGTLVAEVWVVARTVRDREVLVDVSEEVGDGVSESDVVHSIVRTRVLRLWRGGLLLGSRPGS